MLYPAKALVASAGVQRTGSWGIQWGQLDGLAGTG